MPPVVQQRSLTVVFVDDHVCPLYCGQRLPVPQTRAVVCAPDVVIL